MNYDKKISITGYANLKSSQFIGFDKIEVENKTFYYVSDFSNGNIVQFNDNWQYLVYRCISVFQFSTYIIYYLYHFRPLASATFIKTINDQLYISGYNGIYNLDTNMNYIKQYSLVSAYYNGIYYNKSSEKIYVASNRLNRIDVFNTSLEILRSISTSVNVVGLNGYLNSVYAGTASGQILIIQNETLTFRTFPKICSSNNVASITIDTVGFMYISCQNENMLKMFHINGANTGISLSTSGSLFQTSMDSKGRMIICGATFDIFY